MRKFQVTLGLLSLLASLFAGAATVYGMPNKDGKFECSIAVQMLSDHDPYLFIGIGDTEQDALIYAQRQCEDAKSTTSRDGSQILKVDCFKLNCFQ